MKEKRKCQSQNFITSKPILTTHTKPLLNPRSFSDACIVSCLTKSRKDDIV